MTSPASPSSSDPAGESPLGPPAAPPSRSAIVAALAWLSVAAVALTVAMPLVAGRYWAGEFFVTFRPHFAVLALLVAAGLLLARRPRLALASVAGLVIHAAPVIPLYFAPAPPPPPEVSRLRIASINAWFRHQEPDRIVDWIRAQDLDLFVVIELTPELLERLTPLEAEYPNRFFRPSTHSNGSGIWSRRPLADARVLGRESAILVVSLEHAGERITVAAVHPHPPRPWAGDFVRNIQLADLAKVVRDLPRPYLAAGDFNTPNWSPYFTRLLADARLDDLRRGHGIHPTWPAGGFIPGVPIDHVLGSSGDWRATSITSGPDLGSDHLPIIVEVARTRP